MPVVKRLATRHAVFEDVVEIAITVGEVRQVRPLSFSALFISMLRIFACGCGERRTAPTSCPGANVSAP
jgi:hypothetical protein